MCVGVYLCHMWSKIKHRKENTKKRKERRGEEKSDEEEFEQKGKLRENQWDEEDLA